MTYWYDIDGNPITLHQAEALLGDYDKRKIGDDYIETRDGTFRVSTVHLVLDHSHGGPVPLIFETMVFPHAESSDALCLRWSTREQAADGHAKLVQEVTERQAIPAWAEDG